MKFSTDKDIDRHVRSLLRDGIAVAVETGGTHPKKLRFANGHSLSIPCSPARGGRALQNWTHQVKQVAGRGNP